MAKRLHLYMGRRNVSRTGTDSRAVLERQLADSMRDITDNLQQFIDHLNDVAPDILVEALEPTLGKSLDQVPRDTEELADSAYLEAEKYRGGARAVLGYGRNGTPDYAIFVHEMQEYAHADGTKAKFLQDPLDEDYFSIIQALPRLINQAAGL